MRTILIAAVIAILAGIIYQKVVEENVSVKELAGYVAGTASEMINEASKAVNDKDLKGVEETINSVTESAGTILKETRDNFIKEKLPEMINIDMQEVWQTVTCEKALAIYNDYNIMIIYQVAVRLRIMKKMFIQCLALCVKKVKMIRH